MFAVCVARDADPGLNRGKAKPLYDLLVTFADVSSRDTGQGYPYRETLATYLDCSKQTVDRAADSLEREVGLIKIHRRRVEGRPDENDANLYEIVDAWLIHGVPPPADTPPQLVARYGHTVPGLDVDAWIGEHAPRFDLAGWRTASDAKLQEQEAKRAEQRRKERARRRKPRQGGGVAHDATPGDRPEDGGGVTGDATGGVMGDVTGGVIGDALSRAVTPEPSSTGRTAPSARSAGGVRSTSTSGSSASGRGGCAAPGRNIPATSNDEQTSASDQRPGVSAVLLREQKAAVHAVEALLPKELIAELPYGHIPTQNRAVVLEAWESRTVDQLRARIARRWTAYGYEPALRAGQLRSAVGVALELIAPTPYCPDQSCEDGVMVDAGEECKACVQRRAARRADRLAGKAPATGRSGTRPRAPECVDCGRPFPGAVPADQVCERCATEASVALAALASRLSQPEQEADPAHTPAGTQEAEGPSGRGIRRFKRPTAEAEGRPCGRDGGDVPEDTRLRAQLLAANPWMAQYTQMPSPADDSPPPF
ncbi:hypothetical protein [Streptomyces parvulus]